MVMFILREREREHKERKTAMKDGESIKKGKRGRKKS
jgi:hypothetical protein